MSTGSMPVARAPPGRWSLSDDHIALGSTTWSHRSANLCASYARYSSASVSARTLARSSSARSAIFRATRALILPRREHARPRDPLAKQGRPAAHGGAEGHSHRPGRRAELAGRPREACLPPSLRGERPLALRARTAALHGRPSARAGHGRHAVRVLKPPRGTHEPSRAASLRGHGPDVSRRRARDAEPRAHAAGAGSFPGPTPLASQDGGARPRRALARGAGGPQRASRCLRSRAEAAPWHRYPFGRTHARPIARRAGRQARHPPQQVRQVAAGAIAA